MKVLVTGGSRGIGKSIHDLFVEKGHTVWAPCRSELNLLETSLSLPKKEFDIVINNAGINQPKSILDTFDQNDIMQVNYFTPLKIVQQCLPYMVKQQYGRIINIGSIWIDLAKQNRGIYSASKSALHALTKSIVVEYSGKNILTNTISPGYILTDLTKQNNTSPQLKKISKNIPVGRLGTPEEIAKTVYYLTVENTYITGQNIIIDGGFSCIVH